jgi:hypothetical protein
MEAEAATCGDDPGVRGRRAEVARGEERKRGGARNRDGGGDSGNGWSSGDPKERAGRPPLSPWPRLFGCGASQRALPGFSLRVI